MFTLDRDGAEATLRSWAANSETDIEQLSYNDFDDTVAKAIDQVVYLLFYAGNAILCDEDLSLVVYAIEDSVLIVVRAGALGRHTPLQVSDISTEARRYFDPFATGLDHVLDMASAVVESANRLVPAFLVLDTWHQEQLTHAD